MSYLSFILIFILPPAAIGLGWMIIRYRDIPPGGISAVGILILLALGYTIPWDRHLILSGVWGYPADRVIGTLFSIPIEELSFMVLQTIAVGTWSLYLTHSFKPDSSIPTSYAGSLQFERFRWLGIGITVQITLFGILLLQIDGARYLGLLFAWVGPVFLLQFAVGGHLLWKLRSIWATSVLPPFLYLCLVDRFAIGMGIWYFSPQYTSGITLLGLPIEEGLFFLFTSAMVAQGTILYPAIRQQWASNPALAPSFSRGWLRPDQKQ